MYRKYLLKVFKGVLLKSIFVVVMGYVLVIIPQEFCSSIPSIVSKIDGLQFRRLHFKSLLSRVDKNQ